MMELQDFVKQTLVQVVSGVKAAQDETESTGAKVNPVGLDYPSKAEGVRFHSPTFRTAEVIEFDVAVTITQGKKTEGGIGLFVGPVVLGSRGKSDAASGLISRIKFSVPVFLPQAG